MTTGPLVQIVIRGANVVIIDNTVYAALISPPDAATWSVSALDDGTFQFTDQASGLILGLTGVEPGTRATAVPSDSAAPVKSWKLTQFTDAEGDDPAPIKDVEQLHSGYCTIQDPGSGAYLFRNSIEDRSLLPKFVGVPSMPDDGPLEVVIKVVG